MLVGQLPGDTVPADFDELADNRSSSLSELGDASDEQSEPTPRPLTATGLDEDDSEAETELLEITPRKLTRTGTDTSLLNEALYTRTPSKLAHSRTIEQHDDSGPPTPSAMTDDAAETDGPLLSLSLAAASESAGLYVGKKRKRDSIDGSLVDDQEDGPARKRSGTVKISALDDLADAAADRQENDVDEELENAEERLSQLAHEELDLEERQANIAAETVNELATVAKHTKPRKGGRRGKRKTEDISYANNEALVGTETHEGDGDGEGDEDDSGIVDEEVAKKKMAIDKLAEIERKFKVFREK